MMRFVDILLLTLGCYGLFSLGYCVGFYRGMKIERRFNAANRGVAKCRADFAPDLVAKHPFHKAK